MAETQGLDGLLRRAAGIRMLAMDVDGVMTDGKLWYGPVGEQLKAFDVRDGHGLVQLVQAGIGTAIISGRSSEALRQRARDLGIADLYLGISDKGEAIEDLADRHGLDLSAVCYIGDDLPDIPALEKAGLPLTVPSAPPAVRRLAAGVTRRHGGHGAIREVCDLLLSAHSAAADK